MKKILLVDDDLDQLFLLERFLKKNGYEIRTASSGKKALETIKAEPIDIALCDFRLPDMDGLDVLKGIKRFNAAIQVIIVTGYSDMRMAVRTVRQGAYDYVTKPLIPDEILLLLKEAGSTPGPGPAAASSTSESKAAASGKRAFVKGVSESAKRVEQHLELIGPTDMTVVIQGESGTGKEVAARTIHHKSKRADKPFVALDCGALPEELAGSELFGHIRGAFTGALTNKKGVFEQANRGTLFLDEIGNLSYDNQVKLLRVLQERKLRRLGADRDIKVDVRVIAATNENLRDAAASGEFREDLFFRLNEFSIELPSLAQRQDDIPELANFFRAQANEALGKSVSGFSARAMQLLIDYPWPGNIRELKNLVKRSVLLAQGDTITPEALPHEVVTGTAIVDSAASSTTGRVRSLKEAVEETERATIEAVMNHVKFNKSKAARILEIDRKTLYTKLEQYAIDH